MLTVFSVVLLLCCVFHKNVCGQHRVLTYMPTPHHTYLSIPPPHTPHTQNASTTALIEQLQHISSQQGKIRDMRNKLAAFKEVMTKQADAFGQLKLTRQVRAAYGQCLAECVRRCGGGVFECMMMRGNVCAVQ